MLIKEYNESRWILFYRSMPTPKTNPCEKCGVADKCWKICPARAKWWDAAMEKLRKGMGL